MASLLTKADIDRLFSLLDADLAGHDVEAELYLVGGAVMCLVFESRASTKDVDAYFTPTTVVREAAARVATSTGLAPDWLNDAVKGYLDPRGDFDRYLELPHLRVFVAHPRYLFALKCAALRLGEEFHDVDDVRYLLRYLDVRSVDEAMAIVTRYVDENRLLPKTRLILEALLTG